MCMSLYIIMNPDFSDHLLSKILSTEFILTVCFAYFMLHPRNTCNQQNLIALNN